VRRHTVCEKLFELIKIYREEEMKTRILFPVMLVALLCIPTLGSAQEIIETDTQYFHVTAGLMRCTFDPDGTLLKCYDENGNELFKYPVDWVTCTLTSPSNPNDYHTIKLNYASDSCQLSGPGSDVGYWVFVRGNWICKCPLGSTSCACPAK
jgi:hypothetical protein